MNLVARLRRIGSPGKRSASIVCAMTSEKSDDVVAQPTDASCPECGGLGQVIDPEAAVKEWRCPNCGHWFAGS
jgi:ribosomal protein L37AE/L43A